METNKFPNFQKCGEILIDIKSKNKKNKIYVFHCTFCNLECDQLKKFSLHIGEEHLNDFGDILKETELKFEAEPEEVKLPSFDDIEAPDIKVFERPIESKANVNPDPLDTVTATSSATNSQNLNCQVKYEIIEHPFDESAADMGVMDGTVSMSDSDKETFDKSDSDDEYIDVPAKKRKSNKTAKKGNQTKRKENSNDTSSDEESKDAECNAKKESNAIKKHKRCKRRWMEASEVINTSPMAQNDSYAVRSKLLSGEFKINAKRGRSEVWKVFGSVENASGEEIPCTVACRDCFNVYKFKNSTSNLVRHKCYIEAATGHIMPKVEVDNITKTPLINLCIKWTVENCRPFKILEDSGFIKVAEHLIAIGAKHGPNVDVQRLLPPPTSLPHSVSKVYQHHFQYTKTEIASIKSNGFSLTFDMWKDDYFKTNYMALAIRYVKEGTLRSKLLAMKCIEAEKCTNEKVKKKLCKILKMFDLELDDKSIVVTDQGSNMVAGFRGCNHINYTAHLLHHTVQKSMQDIDEVAELCRASCKLVKHFKKSGLDANLSTSLKSFSPTRWNSIYSLLVSIEANWNLIYQTLENANELSRINKMNITDIKAIISVLQPFQEAILKLEDEKHATIHFVYMIVHHLQKKCSPAGSDLDIARKLKEKLNGNLSTTILNNLTVFHKIAVYLFPPANKLLKFSQEEKTEIKDECRRIMTTYITEMSSNEEQTQNADEVKNPVHDFYVEYLQSNQSDEIGAELLKYETVSIPKFTNEFNVLEWWNLHKLEYPLLYKLSCKILGTPTSSAASERVFSAARNLIADKRCIIASNDNILNEIVFLNSNTRKN